MKRKIIYRGKDKDGNWVYGDLIHRVGHKDGGVSTLPRTEDLSCVPNCHPLYGVYVVPETVGQFTGLKSSNGVEIFEDDIVKIVNRTSFIAWSDKEAMFITDGDGCGLSLSRAYYHDGVPTIIGNIHDNPDLLEEI